MRSAFLLLAIALLCQIASKETTGEIMFEEAVIKNLDNWAVEKIKDAEAIVEIHEGKIKCTTFVDKEKGIGVDGVMIWLKSVLLPNNFKFEYDVTFQSDAKDDGFFLLFFCYKHKDDLDLLDPKLFGQLTNNTLFKKYTSSVFDGYHISYRRGEAANCNLRKNAGMSLLHQTRLKKVLPINKKMHVTLTKIDGHIKLIIDDSVFMDFTDDGSINGGIRQGGRIGFRQVYRSSALYENI